MSIKSKFLSESKNLGKTLNMVELITPIIGIIIALVVIAIVVYFLIVKRKGRTPKGPELPQQPSEPPTI